MAAAITYHLHSKPEPTLQEKVSGHLLFTALGWGFSIHLRPEEDALGLLLLSFENAVMGGLLVVFPKPGDGVDSMVCGQQQELVLERFGYKRQLCHLPLCHLHQAPSLWILKASRPFFSLLPLISAESFQGWW
jgi:hypothetical protein